jgi:hypothetical protein
MILTFSKSLNGEPVYLSVKHKEDKRILSYVIKIIKELDITRPEMLHKKVDGAWKLKFLGVSAREIAEMKNQLRAGGFKYNGELMIFEEEI